MDSGSNSNISVSKCVLRNNKQDTQQADAHQACCQAP
jgi:hypothetical protein